MANVEIDFRADNSDLEAKIRQSKQDIQSLQSLGNSRTMNWSEVEQSVRRTATPGGLLDRATIAGKEAAAQRELAAETKKTADAHAAFGQNLQSVGGGIGKFVGEIVKLTIAYTAAKFAVDAVKFAMQSSMDLETASVRFQNLAGNTEAAKKAFTGLAEVSRQTNTAIVDLVPAGNTLLEAGVQMQDIDADLVAMGQHAKVAGTDIDTLANLYLRLATRQELSGRQLYTIEKATGDETGALTKEYQEMTITLPRAAKEMELIAQATKRARDDAQRLRDAMTGFTEKHGGSNKVFAAFQQQSGQGNVPFMTLPGFENTRGQGRKQEVSIWQQLKEGSKQIGKEEGFSGFEMQDRIQKGADSYEDLIAASKRYQEAETIRIDRGNQDANTARNQREEFLKRDLAAKGEQGLTAISPEAKTEYQKYAATTQGKKDQLDTDIKNSAGHVGDLGRAALGAADAVVKWTNALVGYDASKHPVKGMQASDHIPAPKKPGEPGFDWRTYKPEDNGKIEATNNANVVQGLADIVNKLNAIFVSGQ